METLEAGTTFGPYEIEGLIAGGGMGAVYAARHTVYKSPCALKVLHAELQPDDEWRRRFHAEGVVGSALKHPNVLAAREVIIGDEGQIGLVLDLVKEGLTLHRVMSREFSTGLPLVQALRVFLGIVQGIDYAHEKEIVHGDIKPENVLIQGDFRDPSSWTPMVTDFGTVGILAHPVMVDGMPAVVVSPRYASPEHLKGMKHLEPRSDVYCLGLLLHYLVTGTHASTARSVEEASKRVTKPVPTTALVDQPESLTAIFTKATSFKPSDRYRTARDLALAVRDLLEQLGEGLELDDLQADLATEIMEEQREQARKLRAEARRAALEAETADPRSDAPADEPQEEVAAEVREDEPPDGESDEVGEHEAQHADNAPADTGSSGTPASSETSASSDEPEPAADAGTPGADAEPIDAAAPTAAPPSHDAPEPDDEAPRAGETPTGPIAEEAPAAAAPTPAAPSSIPPAAEPPADADRGGVPVMVWVAIGVVALIVIAVVVMNLPG